MSETGMNLSNPLDGERRVGSVGLPLPGVEVRIVDPSSESPLGDNEIGEVQVRGANVFKGYWREPRKDGRRLHRGRLVAHRATWACAKPDGYYTLKGRCKDLIIRAVYNVYPPEVELVLTQHPAVNECAVIGCPDDEWGERVAAVVVPHDGLPATTPEIIAFCRERLAHYKAPRQVVSSTNCRATPWARSRRHNCATSFAAEICPRGRMAQQAWNSESERICSSADPADEQVHSHDERMLRLLEYIPQRRIGVFDHLRPQRWNWYLVRRPMERSLERQTPEPLTIRQTRNLRLFWLDGIFAAASEAFYLAFIPLFALAYGATNQQVGWITAVGNLAGAMALFPVHASWKKPASARLSLCGRGRRGTADAAVAGAGAAVATAA